MAFRDVSNFSSLASSFFELFRRASSALASSKRAESALTGAAGAAAADGGGAAGLDGLTGANPTEPGAFDMAAGATEVVSAPPIFDSNIVLLCSLNAPVDSSLRYTAVNL